MRACSDALAARSSACPRASGISNTADPASAATASGSARDSLTVVARLRGSLLEPIGEEMYGSDNRDEAPGHQDKMREGG